MEVFVSIDGVLRNTLQKFDYHYKDYFLNTESESEETFGYEVTEPILNDNVLSSYKFQSYDEFVKFLYFDFPIEIFGHAGLSYNQASTELNSLVFENPNIKFTLIGLMEKGKAKPSTLFFLSRNGVICDNITFAKEDENQLEINKLSEIKKEWLKYSERTITSTLKGLLQNVKQAVLSKTKTVPKV